MTEYLTTIYILIEIYLSVFFVYCSFNSSLLCYIPVTRDIVQPTDYHRFTLYRRLVSLVWQLLGRHSSLSCPAEHRFQVKTNRNVRNICIKEYCKRDIQVWQYRVLSQTYGLQISYCAINEDIAIESIIRNRFIKMSIILVVILVFHTRNLVKVA